MDKNAAKNTKAAQECTLFYNCVKRRPASERCFNFETEIDVSIFLSENLKKSNAQPVKAAKKTTKNAPLSFYLAYD